MAPGLFKFAPLLGVTNFTTDASNVGSGVYMIAVLAVVIGTIIALAIIVASPQGKFTKGIELFLTVVLGVLIVGQINSWATSQGTGRAALVAALFNGLPGDNGGGQTSALTEQTLDQLMK